MTRIKICGITNYEDAIKAVRAGCDAVGFVFAASPRQINIDTARMISGALPPFVSKVGVFTESDKVKIEKVVRFCGLSAVQIYNTDSYNADYEFGVPIIKAFRANSPDILKSIEREKCPYFLLDSFVDGQMGGSGRTFDWEIAKTAAVLGYMILAGGLNHRNIRDALEMVRPYGVDVSSGVEKCPGIKDHHKMQLFINEVRKWDYRIN